MVRSGRRLCSELVWAQAVSSISRGLAGAGLGLTCSCISTSVRRFGSELARRRFCGLSSGSGAAGAQGDATGVGAGVISKSSKDASSNCESALRLGGRAWGWARVCGCGCCWSSWSIIEPTERVCLSHHPPSPIYPLPFARPGSLGHPNSGPAALPEPASSRHHHRRPRAAPHPRAAPAAAAAPAVAAVAPVGTAVGARTEARAQTS